MRGPMMRGSMMRGSWEAWRGRSGALLAAVVLGYFVGILSPGWVRAQPTPSNRWAPGTQLNDTDLNRLVGRVEQLEARATAPRIGTAQTLDEIRGSAPVTFPAIASASLVVFTPGGGGVGQVTYEVSLGSVGRLVRVSNTGGDTAVLPVPANTAFTVTAELGTGASPILTVIRFPLN
jgi:hypothetical protein